ncbi:MAG: neutral zinc metallopeptidase [Hyphomicrobiales bacterium]|nr:neutral zinc metallopeptidase [Hyphomicrobiales bacterium]
MRWEDLPESQNVEDRRGDDGGGYGRGGGGFGGFPGGAGGLSIGTILLLGLIGYATGIDPSLLIGVADQFSRQQPRVEQAQPGPPGRPGASPKDETGRFVTRILASTETTWKDVFARSNRNYRAPVLVLYSGRTHAQCGGTAMAAMGPFYCPADRKIYLDTTFFQMIESRFRGCDVGSQSCRFAQAYVIAHEVAHHVQNELGILEKAHRAQQVAGGRTPEANRIQVRVELQADCLAGIWANRAQERLAPGDVEAALRTASAIGDDTLQKRSQGYVVPDSFTHGTSEQRQRWFYTGFKSGSVNACDTFSTTAQL